MRIYSTSMKYFCFISVPLSLTTYNTIMSISHLTSGMQCMASLVKRPSSMNLVLNHNESLNQFNSVYIYIYMCVCVHFLQSSSHPAFFKYAKSYQYALHHQTIAASWRNLRCTRIPHWPGVSQAEGLYQTSSKHRRGSAKQSKGTTLVS